MKKIAVTVSDEIYRRARSKAAEPNTSGSRLVADYLRALSKDEELRAERNKRLDELFAKRDRGRKRMPVGPFKREKNLWPRSLLTSTSCSLTGHSMSSRHADCQSAPARRPAMDRSSSNSGQCSEVPPPPISYLSLCSGVA